MADTINKPSIQIRSGLPSPLSDKSPSPSPSTKLLISHGKPNFTIARSPKVEVEDNVNPLSPQLAAANNNYNPYKCANNNKFVVGTKFNGVFKPSTAAASWATSNGNGTAESNEAAKVVLRRAKQAEPVDPVPAAADAAEDDNVPEFIRRQRRIQERLAKENVLDFENRRSGYFTHVMISPDSPNRTSFAETMASPAIVPSLEMPLPAKIEEEQAVENGHGVEARALITNGHSVEEQPLSNGHAEKEQEQVQVQEQVQQEAVKQEPVQVQEPVQEKQLEQEQPLSNGHADKIADPEQDVAPEDVAKAIEEVNKAVEGEDDGSKPEEQVEVEVAAETQTTPSAVEAKVEVVTPAAQEAAITISHTNGHSSDVPSIATPDPSGALGVNYEPKTVVSFSQELGSGENNYPDTVQVVKEVAPADAQLQELSKLKFDIQNDAQNGEVQVTPVLRAE